VVRHARPRLAGIRERVEVGELISLHSGKNAVNSFVLLPLGQPGSMLLQGIAQAQRINQQFPGDSRQRTPLLLREQPQGVVVLLVEVDRQPGAFQTTRCVGHTVSTQHQGELPGLLHGRCI